MSKYEKIVCTTLKLVMDYLALRGLLRYRAVHWVFSKAYAVRIRYGEYGRTK